MSRRPKRQPTELKEGDTQLGDAVTPAHEHSQTLPIQAIQMAANQPRRYFDPKKLAQLAESVQQHGILEPLLVRPLKGGLYELVAGERRYRAAQQIGLAELPVIVRELSDDEAIQLALIENLQREDLNSVEETEGILQLLSMKLNRPTDDVSKLLYRMQHAVKGNIAYNVMGDPDADLVQSVFASIGTMTWESFVNNRLPLLRLPDDVLNRLRQGQLEYTKAQAIARVKDNTRRLELLNQAVTEALSLSKIREQIRAEQSPTTDEIESLHHRMRSLSQKFRKSGILYDAKKRKQLEKLLAQVESLLI